MSNTALGDIYDALQSRVKSGDARQLHSYLIETVSECSNLESRIKRLEAEKIATSPTTGDGRSDYDFEAYRNGDQEERLRIIQNAYLASTNSHQRQFFSGMMFADSLGLDQHPDWFACGCACDTCLSYGDV